MKDRHIIVVGQTFPVRPVGITTVQTPGISTGFKQAYGVSCLGESCSDGAASCSRANHYVLIFCLCLHPSLRSSTKPQFPGTSIKAHFLRSTYGCVEGCCKCEVS